MKHRFPLNKPRRRNREVSGVGRGLGPFAPVTLGVLDIAGAGEEVEAACELAFASARPHVREDSGIEDVALVVRLGIGAVREQIELAGVGGGDEIALRRVGKANCLRGIQMGQVFKLATLVNAVDASAIAGRREQALRSGTQRVDDRRPRSDQSLRGAPLAVIS